MKRYLLLLFASAHLACGAKAGGSGVRARMDFERTDSFYSAPFPSDDLLQADGAIRLEGFPNPAGIPLVRQAAQLIARDNRGFALSGAVYFSFTGPLGTTHLPTVLESIGPDATIFLLEWGGGTIARSPVEVTFNADGGPFGAPNLLSILPVQGFPLRPNAAYAAVVLRRTGDAEGRTLGQPSELEEITSGRPPAGMGERVFASYRAALKALNGDGVATRDIAALSVFTTGDPATQMAAYVKDAVSRPIPAPTGPFVQAEVFDDYCVYHSTIAMPDYQQGVPPYATEGGGWELDAQGRPILHGVEEANMVITLPRAPMPPSGFPTVVFIRTGGGGDRPLVDRGPQDFPGADARVPGTGPALHFARAGFAGISVDGPHGGLRNVSRGDEQFLMFNVLNPVALRDNVRQSALEIALVAHVVERLEVDASGCPGLDSAGVRFDVERLALMGHSMGATIAPLAMAMEPRYRAAILSGAGGSWIENILYKRKPVEVRPIAEALLGYKSAGRALAAGDPVLTLVQWGAESADPQVYARRIVTEPAPGERPRHVLMLQGIVDHYILPRIANALSLPLGLDLAGEERDGPGPPDLIGQTPLSTYLPLTGRSHIPLPAAGNVEISGERVTAVVIQHPEDGLEDGHEVVFQTEAPQYQYRCFLDSFRRGIPRVPAGGPAIGPCGD
ncbi:MAG: hypothetical protein HYT87_15965 [Nitrospirae bacterium]|nr:hypothetical protein [Nitrospirota bacterium]